MKNKKNQTPTNNKINLQAEALIDLPVDEARQDEINGGINYAKIEITYLEQKPDGRG